jgi:hypothetical protein
MNENPERYIYLIDGDDRIIYVNQAWLNFAQENDGAEITANHVMEKSIFEFITGGDTQSLYAALHTNVRARRKEIVIPFRCDSPSTIRQMTLTLRPLDNGAIEYEGHLVRKTVRNAVTVLFRLADRTDRTIPICSLCRRVSVQAEWLELSDVVVQLPSLQTAMLPRLLETVCPTCIGYTGDFGGF